MNGRCASEGCGRPAAAGSALCFECREAALRPPAVTPAQAARAKEREKLRARERNKRVPVPIKRTMSPAFMDRPARSTMR